MTQTPAADPGRVAGIDFGTVRIGVAISDPRRTISSPLENYTRRNTEQDAAWLRELVDDYDIVRFVVGLPIHLSGDESQKSHEARLFGKWLEQTTGVPVVLFDERYTTVMAEQILQSANLTSKKRKAARDKLAAQILLSAYLERAQRGVKDDTGEGADPLEDR